MKTPPTYAVFRITAVSITVLILLLFGLGLSRRGPFDSLGGLTSHAIYWLHINMGVHAR
jgi:hypothetical protein